MKNVILASQSPRRRELLKRVLKEFECIPGNIDETMDRKKPLEEEVKRVSYLKAKAILKDHEDCIVIGSDTTVVLDGKPLGKPKDEEEAFAMLESLQGRSHEVLTGLAILSSKKETVSLGKAEVTFAPMSEKEIRDYIATGECMDKAGAYGIQGYGSRYITSIQGDYYVIMGLSVHDVYEAMKCGEEY